MNKASMMTNQTISLGQEYSKRAKLVPKVIKQSIRHLRAQYSRMVRSRVTVNQEQRRSSYIDMRYKHRHIVRQVEAAANEKRDRKLFTLVSGDPRSVYSKIWSQRLSAGKIQLLTVGNTEYSGNNVPDGFYDRFSQLKTIQGKPFQDPDHLQQLMSDYEHLVCVISQNKNIPPIQYYQSERILKSLRQSVNDFFSTTSNHYLQAGKAGIDHFHFLLSALFEDINHISVKELNMMYAHVLYKSHGKIKILLSLIA